MIKLGMNYVFNRFCRFLWSNRLLGTNDLIDSVGFSEVIGS